MVDGDVMNYCVIAARQMQALVAFSAAAAHLAPAPSAVRQELRAEFGLRGLPGAPLGGPQACQHIPASRCM